MKKKNGWLRICVGIGCLLFLMFFLSHRLKAEETETGIPSLQEIEKKVLEWMKAGKIPGLILVIVKADEPVFVKGYGYADLETRSPVTPETLFELASCSKSFTALAALHLEEQGLINLDSPVSHYLPWFYVTYNGEKHKITLRQLLHHTSGISWTTISLIPRGSDDDALQKTVRNIVGIQLNRKPGEAFEYATVNYDIVGAVIEKVTGKSFEEYMADYVLNPLGLTSTSIGVEERKAGLPMAAGYKMGFFKPRKYNPPVFRGNNPAAYIVSNGKDMARWLRIQMGLVKTDFDALIQKSHKPDLSVQPQATFTIYGMGWFVNLFMNERIFHSGLNPNFTSYIGFNPKEKIGAAVLVNCNSTFTQFIGNSVIRLLSGQEVGTRIPSVDKVDSFCSIISFVLGLYILMVVAIIVVRTVGIFRGKSSYSPLDWEKLARMGIALLGSIPYLYGVYIIPRAIARMSWDVVIIWAPSSFTFTIVLLISALGISYIQFVFSLIFPTKNKYRNELPIIGILSVLSGLSGTVVLFLITTSFWSSVGLGYLLYYFALAYSVNVAGRKIAQTKMIKLSNNIALDLRINLINKLFATRYQNFEKIQDGRIFTTLNGDTAVLARSAGAAIGFVTNIITMISGFIYLTTISLTSTGVVLFVFVSMIFYNRWVAKKSRVYMEEARDLANVYMGLLNSLISGYKELSIHRRKKYEFRDDLVDSTRQGCIKSIIASVKFLNASLIGDSITYVILGVLSIVVSRVITGVNVVTLISFVMVILYLLTPIRSVVGMIPFLTGLKVAWGRIKELVEELEVEGDQDSIKQFIRNVDLPEEKETIDLTVLDQLHKNVENLKVEGLTFAYEPEDEEHERGFAVGPFDLEVNKGQALFIIGGNGSGKTTIAKLVTGLYLAEKGSIKINGEDVDPELIGEYFTTIYSNYHLFSKIYGTDANEKEPEIKKFLKILNLEKKLQIKDGKFSTLDLSGGQRKRLALMQCWLEDRPIYLFDEVAADQDPEFRKFFYRELLVKMKEKGKIVIAITHDDHYFDVADKIIKMDMGKIEPFEDVNRYNAVNSSFPGGKLYDSQQQE